MKTTLESLEICLMQKGIRAQRTNPCPFRFGADPSIPPAFHHFIVIFIRIAIVWGAIGSEQADCVVAALSSQSGRNTFCHSLPARYLYRRQDESGLGALD